MGKPLRARPTCHVCQKPVESFEEDEAAFGRVRLTARCHGAVEHVYLWPSEAKGLHFVEAFRERPQLPP